MFEFSLTTIAMVKCGGVTCQGKSHGVANKVIFYVVDFTKFKAGQEDIAVGIQATGRQQSV